MQSWLIQERILEIAATCIQAYVMYGQTLSVISGKLHCLWNGLEKYQPFSIRSRALQKSIEKKITLCLMLLSLEHSCIRGSPETSLQIL